MRLRSVTQPWQLCAINKTPTNYLTSPWLLQWPTHSNLLIIVFWCEFVIFLLFTATLLIHMLEYAWIFQSRGVPQISLSEHLAHRPGGWVIYDVLTAEECPPNSWIGWTRPLSARKPNTSACPSNIHLDRSLEFVHAHVFPVSHLCLCFFAKLDLSLDRPLSLHKLSCEWSCDPLSTFKPH